jgi:pseudouridine kinase
MEAVKNEGFIAVIGGANTDIGGRSARALRLGDSNPGCISLRPGGVGRNIAHNLALLGERVRLVSAVGDDLFGQGIRQSCVSLGIDTRWLQTVPGARSAAYLYLADDSGDMHAAVSDMDVTATIRPELLETILGELNEAEAVVLDANLPEETLSFLAERCTAPLYADPVSATKAPRLEKLLPRLTAIKPNALEAQTLTGERDPERAARALLNQGVKRVIISLAAEGLLAAEGEELLYLPCLPGPIVDATGAGDAAMAAVVWATKRALDLRQTTQAALSAGAQTCAVAGTNAPALRLNF